MDKRTFLAIALSILILVIYQEWMTRYYGPSPSAPEVAKQEQERVPTAEQPPPAAPAPGKSIEIPLSRDAKDIRIETDNYVALFTNQGARLKSFKFKKYRTSAGENSPPFEMIPSAPGVPLPLGVQWQVPTPFDDSGLLYSVQGSDLKLTGDSKGTLIFKGQTANGVVITKGLTFSGSTYPIQLEVSIT